MSKVNTLIDIYSNYGEEQFQEEIDALFEIIQAILYVAECDSIESYPTPTLKLKFSAEEIKKGNDYLC